MTPVVDMWDPAEISAVISVEEEGGNVFAGIARSLHEMRKQAERTAAEMDLLVETIKGWDEVLDLLEKQGGR